MSQTLQELIRDTGELRALPATTSRLLRLLDDATAGADEVLEVIGVDPALTANLLKLCNSAYYGLRRQVGTVREALVMLGNQTVVSLAFAASLGDVMRGPLAAYRLARDQLWRHSLATALGAAHLAAAVDDRGVRERAFTAGLIHDIGKLLLNAPLKEMLQQLPTTTQFDDLLAAEVAILGFDHVQAGAALAEAWNFPPPLVRLINLHHAPENRMDLAETDAVLLSAVSGANLAACHLGYAAGTEPPSLEALQVELEALGHDAPTVASLLQQVPAELAGLSAALGVAG